MTPIRKKIKRRRGKSHLYFSAETQEFIEKYQASECHKEKEKIYVEKIFPAFDKLVENLIFVYNFMNPAENYLDLKADCVSFLYETLGKWSPERGTKAFSYFNVVAKNWLIMNSRKNKKRSMRHVSLSDADEFNHDDKTALANFDMVPSPETIMLKKNFRHEILEIMREIQRRVRGEKEVLCINAVITVFRNIDELDFLNKRAIFVYVRDISGLSPKQLSVAMSSIRKHYRDVTKEIQARE